MMEEVAYTWFNRFAALRFMEVNGYLPSHVRVFTNDAGEFKPQILTEAIHLELEGLDLNRVYELEDANKSEELYKYLLIVQCNALNGILPGMFQRISDYTELLFPDNLLRKGSVIEQMITMIPEEDWTDQVQIIGWLYQYYISEKKDKVFADLKKNIKISKENIPAATQLFTPDWIVHYMVENSLGRLWLEGHPNDALKAEWKYYLDEAEQEPDVEAQLAEIRKEYADIKPEEIRVIDPCMGSGHILCVLFDVLVRIYEDYGYTAREAVRKIVEKNLYGLDIDERAAQLAYFSVMMKARQYDRRFFSKKDAYGNPDVPRPHVYPIIPSSRLDPAMVKAFMDDANELFQDERPIADNTRRLLEQMRDADEYGSIITVKDIDFSVWYGRYDLIVGGDQMTMTAQKLEEQFLPFLRVAEMLAMKFDVVVTNPPYMGGGNMNEQLSEFVKKTYPNTKTDLFSCFMERGFSWVNKFGFLAMITMESWMFLSSFERFRNLLLHDGSFVNMVHMPYLGKGGTSLGISFGTTVFSYRKNFIHYKGQFSCIRYYETDDDGIPFDFPTINERFSYTDNDSFNVFPGRIIAYWVRENMRNTFERPALGSVLTTREGMATANNDLFLRFWYEVPFQHISFGVSSPENMRYGMKWVPYNKGGEFRKWYGNNDYIVNWENDGYEIRNNQDPKTGRIRSHNYNGEYGFRKGITWSALSSAKISVRYAEQGFLFDSKGAKGFADSDDTLLYSMALINSVVGLTYLDFISPTIDFKVGDIIQIPFIENPSPDLLHLIRECVDISKCDWDSFETSWDFEMHPIVKKALSRSGKDDTTIFSIYGQVKAEYEERFFHLKSNETQINDIFIDTYGLNEELKPDVSDEDVSVNEASLQRDVRSLLSYAVGCMFGRYSVNGEGLQFAGGDWADWYKDNRDRLTGNGFFVDENNIIPITDDEYFEDDIVGYFVRFVKTVFGEDTLEANLQFIADALGGKGTARQVIRSYFLNDFYADHCKIYQKRPIYWLFDSGKKNGFKCLIYMHRYRPDTIARIRTDYVHGQQSRYRTAIADLEQRMNGAPTSERVKLSKQLAKIQDQAEELRLYEEKIHHLADQMISIDLDDGVKENYAKFQDVLAKIK